MTRPSPTRGRPAASPASQAAASSMPTLPATVTPFRAAWAVLLWPTQVRNSEWEELLGILPEAQRRDFDRLRKRPVMLYGYPRFSYAALPIALIVSHPTSAWTVLTGLCLGGGVMFIAERLMSNRLNASAQRLGGSYSSITGLTGPDWTAVGTGADSEQA